MVRYLPRELWNMPSFFLSYYNGTCYEHIAEWQNYQFFRLETTNTDNMVQLTDNKTYFSNVNMYDKLHFGVGIYTFSKIIIWGIMIGDYFSMMLLHHNHRFCFGFTAWQSYPVLPVGDITQRRKMLPLQTTIISLIVFDVIVPRTVYTGDPTTVLDDAGKYCIYSTYFILNDYYSILGPGLLRNFHIKIQVN